MIASLKGALLHRHTLSHWRRTVAILGAAAITPIYTVVFNRVTGTSVQANCNCLRYLVVRSNPAPLNQFSAASHLVLILTIHIPATFQPSLVFGQTYKPKEC